MENMYFSPTTVGFYVSEQERPDDAVEVSPEVEAFLRECVIWGADTFCCINAHQQDPVFFPFR